MVNKHICKIFYGFLKISLIVSTSFWQEFIPKSQLCFTSRWQYQRTADLDTLVLFVVFATCRFSWTTYLPWPERSTAQVNTTGAFQVTKDKRCNKSLDKHHTFDIKNNEMYIDRRANEEKKDIIFISCLHVALKSLSVNVRLCLWHIKI